MTPAEINDQHVRRVDQIPRRQQSECRGEAAAREDLRGDQPRGSV
jgi:hypothetical protein